MSKFAVEKINSLTPYTPGEQPKNMEYIKLNTNESPFAPSPLAVKYANEVLDKLQLYPDPTCSELTGKIAESLNVSPEEVLVTNGSDEILNFAFMAYCDDKTGVAFPNITYGFYKVFAELYNIDYKEIPLQDNFTININDYFNLNRTIFIANPNAPTGIALSVNEIEEILINNKGNIVIIDEAYVDFGSESCVKLINKYDNLLVTQTFSKSRSMAGGRIGFGVANKDLINDLNKIKYSTNPYNINKVSMAAGLGSIIDEEYTLNNCKKIIENREYTVNELNKLGFECLDSSANFILAKHPEVNGEKIYLKLKEKGILIRHFDKKEIINYNRITVGSLDQMNKFLEVLKVVLEDK